MSDLWHPNAQRVLISTAPQNLLFTGGGRKLVWHTTEGASIVGAVGAYKSAGVCPHFTIYVDHGKRTLYQHLPVNRAASALRHPANTPSTNTANAIQVEICGFASESPDWPMSKYHYLHELARWIHTHCEVPMTEGVDWKHPTRLTESEFIRYEGHCGHMHVPNNDHGDPGKGFHIYHVLHDVPGERADG